MTLAELRAAMKSAGLRVRLVDGERLQVAPKEKLRLAQVRGGS